MPLTVAVRVVKWDCVSLEFGLFFHVEDTWEAFQPFGSLGCWDAVSTGEIPAVKTGRTVPLLELSGVGKTRSKEYPAGIESKVSETSTITLSDWAKTREIGGEF